MDWFIGRRKDPDGGPDTYFLETDGEKVTRDLNDPATDTLYYLIKETGGDNIVAQKATLKGGPRNPGDNLEIAITEADNIDVASAQVVV